MYNVSTLVRPAQRGKYMVVAREKKRLSMADIEYQLGKLNQNADALSRIPQNDPTVVQFTTQAIIHREMGSDKDDNNPIAIYRTNCLAVTRTQTRETKDKSIPTLHPEEDKTNEDNIKATTHITEEENEIDQTQTLTQPHEIRETLKSTMTDP